MNWLDIIILIVLGILTFWGLMQGLIKAVVLLLATVLAIVLAGVFQDPLADALDFINNESAANIIAFMMLLVGIFIICYILGSIARRILQMTFLGWVDRLGGAFLGFVMAWLICSVIIALIARYAALPMDLSDPDAQSAEISASADEKSSNSDSWIPELPDAGDVADKVSDTVTDKIVGSLEGVRHDIYNTLDDSALATIQLDSFPVILGLLPGDFDPVKDFFED